MFIAHKRESGAEQSLKDHLENVANIAAQKAEKFGFEKLAYQMGLTHDLGKYSNEFQRRIKEDGPKVDHATFGGKLLYENGDKKPIGVVGAYGVMGHHTGLPDGGSKNHATPEESTFYGRVKRENLPNASAYSKEITVENVSDCHLKSLGSNGFTCSFLARMLYSCLVDADFLDTECFMDGTSRDTSMYAPIDELYKRFSKYIEKFENPTTEINIKRNEILSDCLKQSDEKQGLFSLTVPTGGGKTIASLGFALKHAVKHKMDRVIYVIPYTSIIEQNAEEIGKILGHENVIQHHSNISYNNEDSEKKSFKYLATENWDAPIIVTTNVQFFESFFAYRSSKCRKLHSVANSVVIFDEAQMIPTPHLKPCVQIIAELVYNYNTTAVLCTATQPALDKFFPKEIIRKEICDNPKELYDFFRRTTIVDKGKIENDALLQELNAKNQVLCIVGTRAHAQDLFDGLDDGIHLSTLMYPMHRRAKIQEIRKRLGNADSPHCRVVSTSLIEAGVDLDFPSVYRARAGLDSIIQAAGRCNREGKHSAIESEVVVFEADDTYRLPSFLQQPMMMYNQICRDFEDVGSPEAIHSYFEKLFTLKEDELDKESVLKRFEDGWSRNISFPFREIARDFKMIDSNTYAVFIPIEDRAKELDNLILSGQRTVAILRELGMYSVNVYENHLNKLLSSGSVEFIDKNYSTKFEEGVFVLRDLSLYSRDTGLFMGKEKKSSAITI